MEAGEEGGEVIIGVSVWGDEVNVGASYTLCESSLSHYIGDTKKTKKIIKLGEGKRKKKNMAIEVFLPIDVLVIPFGPDVSTQF